ncbi:MAG: alcohol dehydrogenase catalytic domain-containing protein [Nitrososphaerota archaeon]|jgi:L-iditol 2-dehydrogenase|nr:alcohol dehydrogenase catalytic domain-containing protein [Nitrososphaerota archaeon]
MKAVIYDPAGGFKVRTIEAPHPAPGELLVKMKVCGLCGTDLEKIHGTYTAAMPVVGHEPAGVVEETGQGVKGFSPGDRVFVHHHVPCGECELCIAGNPTMCNRYRSSNIVPGGFSEYFIAPAWNVERGGVLKLPDKLDFEDGALIEPTACCIRGLQRAGAKNAKTAVVVGSGPVGLTHVRLLSRSGTRVFVSDVNKKRLAIAYDMGAEEAYDASQTDVPDSIRRKTSGLGADLAIVAAGSPAAVTQAVRSIRKGGKICLFGVPIKGSRLEYDLSDLFNSEQSIETSYGASEIETNLALQMMKDDDLGLRKMITHRFRLEEFEKAVELSMKGESLKTVMFSD